MAYRFFVLFFILCFSVSAKPLDTVFPQISVEVNGKSINLEYADTFELRAQGLMFRESMCNDCGMLFNYNQNRIAAMWMRNTLIPLDVAFIRRDGVITDIKSMKPHDETTITSSEKVVFAWEMNKNWFKNNDISVGDKVNISQE